MILQIKISDELYQHYADRKPSNPRAAIEEALEKLKGLDPAQPREILEGAALRKLKELGLTTGDDLAKWVERQGNFSVAGVEVPLSLGQRQRLAQLAQFMAQPIEGYVKQQLGTLLVRELGG